MKNKTLITMLLILIILISGCTTSLTTKETKTGMSREEAEAKALQFVYEHTSNKEIYTRELTIKNYVFDSWKEENVWHVIIYVSHTFIEVLVYDDGTGQIKVLTKTDYWKRVPSDVKKSVIQDTNKNSEAEIS